MKKTNVAELLKDCPKGMELYSTIYGTVYFEGVRDTGNAVLIVVTTFCNTEVFFYPDGKFNTYYSDSEMTLFPSKDVRTWEGFIPRCKFKDGDIVATTSGNWIGITKGCKNDDFISVYCVIKSNGEFEAYFDRKGTWGFDRLATEDEKQKLFDAIKANGYKWNAETKTLEKLIEPKFKVGDRVRSIISSGCYTIVDIKNDKYFIESDISKNHYQASFDNEANFELVPNKFDITTLKPFDKVLVAHKRGEWHIQFFEKYSPTSKFPFICIGGSVYQKCVPYGENKHLMGTTNDCDEYFKTWEN